MSTLAQLRDLRNRLATSDKLRSTVDHAADIAALDALLVAVDALDAANSRIDWLYEQTSEIVRGPLWDTYTEAVRRRTAARARIDAILRGEL